MSNLSISVMMHQIVGDFGGEVFRKAIGHKITTITLDGATDVLHIGFDSGLKLQLRDDGQSCCESRYMRTDDNLQDFVGATLLSGEIADAPEQGDEYGNVHEVQFLRIHTDRGAIVFSSHNEHNGYYGGFAIIVREE